MYMRSISGTPWQTGRGGLDGEGRTGGIGPGIGRPWLHTRWSDKKRISAVAEAPQRRGRYYSIREGSLAVCPRFLLCSTRVLHP
jgi:hypothetical protein